MRISTNQVYQNGLNNLLKQQARVTQLQSQLANDYIKVQYSSDDPIAFAQMEWMSQIISTTELYQKNSQNTENTLNLEEAILSDCVNNIQRLREIQVQVGDGSLSTTQRQALASEASDILTQLLAFANSKDNNGDYLFSGGQSTTQPFTLSGGQYLYSGDSTQRFQFISNSLQIAINDPGDGLFMRIPSGNGYFAVSQTATPNTGTASVSTGSVTNAAAYVPDNYTINFTLNTAGQLVVMVQGATSGNVIPPTGLPDDAPLYQPGMSLSFNGINLEISDMPQPGDAFSVTPSQNVSIFETIQEMINSLNQPFDTATDKAAAVTINNQLLTQIDSALINISTVLSSVGSRLNQITSAQDANDDLVLSSQAILKGLREEDPIVLAETLNIQLINLQAAQQSYVRIQGLSLFNYIR